MNRYNCHVLSSAIIGLALMFSLSFIPQILANTWPYFAHKMELFSKYCEEK